MRGVRKVLGLGASVAVLSWAVVPVATAADGTGAYAQWTQDGSTGTITMESAGFASPSASLTTNGGSLRISSGATIWLGPTTPFGAQYGSSQDSPYLGVGLSAGSTPSTTTYTFNRPTPVGTWSFAFGDIDADFITLSATDASGDAITSFTGWFQGGFNYCDVSPKPSGCPSGTHTDVPTWYDDTATLMGNGSDTSGAAGWFTPTVSLSSLTFTFDKITGIPTYQTWFAGDGPSAPSATTTSATSITEISATLNATVNANYTPSTTQFRYALSAVEVSSGQGTVATAVPGAVSGGDDTTVSASLTGLTASSTYYYRIEVDPGATSIVSGAVLSFTTADPPPPPPPTPVPPSPPGKPAVTPHDSSITTTWTPSADPGTAPINGYIATASPGGESCTTTAGDTSCTITGLTNGTTYTVTVIATSADGISLPSLPSDPVAPKPDVQPSILISGSRVAATPLHDRIDVHGVTVDIEAGTVMTPMVSLDGGPMIPGSGAREVSEDGDFDWTREVRVDRDLSVAFTDGQVTSNTLVFDVIPSIMITGSRDSGRLEVQGLTEHIVPGTVITPLVTLDDDPQQPGVGLRRVRNDGEFTWQRKIADGRTATVAFTGAGATSNPVTFPSSARSLISG